ncbi:MAG: DUF2846 domain-containing protein [Bacteroidales bacterium]|nr:DUF2846 domain-containing protein [Bacteroidales bacterium]
MNKRIFVALAIVFSLMSLWASAQDVIVTKGSKKIEAKVTEVNVDDIKYKRFDNLDGPDYVLPKNDVLTIVYQNGNVEVYGTEETAVSASEPVSVPVPENTPVTASVPVSDPAPANEISAGTEELLQGDYALLHIYRKGAMAGAAIGYDVYLDDENLFRAKNNSKTTIKVTKEGMNTLRAKTETKVEIPIDIQFGREYYIRCGMKMGAFVGRPDIELVDNHTGITEFEKISSDKNSNTNRSVRGTKKGK